VYSLPGSAQTFNSAQENIGYHPQTFAQYMEKVGNEISTLFELIEYTFKGKRTSKKAVGTGILWADWR